MLPASAFGATDVIKVNVPFAFVVAGQHMPAGSYDLQSSDTGAVLYIQGQGGNIMVASETVSTGSNVKPALFFEKHNGTNVLVKARMADLSTRSVPSGAF
jgi:hypothetical protein